MEVGNIKKAATCKSFLQFVTVLFNNFHEKKINR